MKSDNRKLTIEQCKDSGLALVLICLIGYLVWKPPFLVPLAVLFLVVSMTYPPLFKPFAIFWFALSTALGSVVSKIILTFLFYGLVLPVGFVRRLMGKDSMQVKSWRKGKDSVFRERNHRFTAEDLANPY